MKKILFILSFSLLLAACDKDDNGGKELLVDIKPIGTLTKQQLKDSNDFPEFSVFIQSDISVYKVEYDTQYKSNTVKASGLFIIPINANSETPALIYNHGTIVKEDAPSLTKINSLNGETKIICLAASVLNCPVLIPDYIGYGSSENITHPYIHTETLGQASFDFVKAYINYAEYAYSAANKNIVITGYSEGGLAAVALHKKIQDNPSEGIKVIKTYAGAGPYDNESMIKEIISTNETLPAMNISSYLWAFNTYKTELGYSKAYDKILSESDNETLATGSYDFGYYGSMKYNINLNPQNLFSEEFKNSVLTNIDTELSNILKSNSVTNFVPKDSLILFHSEADKWVFVSNTLNAYNNMKAKNAPVRAEIISKELNLDHEQAATEFLKSTLLNIITTGALN